MNEQQQVKHSDFKNKDLRIIFEISKYIRIPNFIVGIVASMISYHAGIWFYCNYYPEKPTPYEMMNIFL